MAVPHTRVKGYSTVEFDIYIQLSNLDDVCLCRHFLQDREEWAIKSKVK